MKDLSNAQELIYQLVELMESDYQKQSLQAFLELFLKAQGTHRPQHSQVKSASALSRFLNHYLWSARALIRQVRRMIKQQLSHYHPRGRRPHLQVIVDLTTLEKRGKFKGYQDLVHVFDGKRGLHLVVIYLVVGRWRLPWSFRVYRGKGYSTPAQLGLKLVRQLPRWLKRQFQVMVLADTAFGSIEFLKGLRSLRLHAITGVRRDRLLQDGRPLWQLHKPGQQVRLQGLNFPVTVAWFYLKRDGERKPSKRYVLSTKALKASTIVWWGRHRWQIEGFFKTAKYRFGLHQFGQKTLTGMYRWLILSLVAFLLAHWGYLSLDTRELPDWGVAATIILETCLVELVIALLLAEVERQRPLLKQQGLDVQITRCKI
jgi:hypothetical protein